MIVGGFVSVGVVDLTAGCSTVLDVKKMNTEAKEWVWKQISGKASKPYRCAGCSTYRGGPEQRLSTGLVAAHAYGIVDTYRAHGVQLVKIRNPWGHSGEWKGPWSDGDKAWGKNKAVSADIKHVAKNDGVFWMSWEDFLAQWDRIYLVKVFSKNWQMAQIFGKTTKKGVYTTSFQLSEETPLAIMVEPQCNMFAGNIKKKTSYPALSFTISRGNTQIDAVRVNGFRGASWWSSASVGYKCPAGTYTVKVTYSSATTTPFYVRVYSRTSLNLTPLQ